ncbi:uncharacterized protein DSM5745_06510 [Aspergillus mulundensis]|uniref:Uncharacterized protein n=1 Tax=Aspergillus mulundensis TaxID=1810919 RepID=A0A3D8RRE0_9EURO|nr:hypothetical protein DSM5745_06510 [Aspergillus mulundensis]RDW76518.1 hypothetical protein DSM5745_06510 [Aspergillus mulundensis]
MRFSLAALAALVASATAFQVDPPLSAPFNLNVDQTVTFAPAGDTRGVETVYLYLTNWNQYFPEGSRPCVYLGSAQRNAGSLMIPARTARGVVPYQGSGYQIRLYSPNQAGCGDGFLAQSGAFEAIPYNNP